jgi:hypothetical protein
MPDKAIRQVTGMAHSQAPVSTKPPFAIEIGPLAKSEEELADEGRIMSDKGRLSD